MGDSAEEIADDVAMVGRIDAVPSLLRVICQSTGMGFAAVARVTDGTWTACAVQDDIAFGLAPGGQLDVDTTLCKESRQARAPVVIDHASLDPAYAAHHTPQLYGIESYISVPIVLSDGAYFGNLCAIDPRPAKVSEPRIVAMFTLFADLIGVHLENERQRQIERAAFLDEKAAGELREQFIAVLGHDLRSPLAAIQASAQLLVRPGADPARVPAIAGRIGGSAKRMAALIDDVLDFARGRLGGGFGVTLTDTDDLGATLADLVAEVQASAPSRKVEVDIDIRHRVRCDRGRLQQLAANLLTNALIHGDAATPARFSARTDDRGFVLQVTNQGEPIPPNALSQVFAPFWRRATSNARDGLGLGLFICAQIVQAHGGTLEVVSSAEQGTTFTARLPSGAEPLH
jgi:signal transduction histidine kinase